MGNLKNSNKYTVTLYNKAGTLKSMLQVFPLGLAPAAVVIGLQTSASQELL